MNFSRNGLLNSAGMTYTPALPSDPSDLGVDSGGGGNNDPGNPAPAGGQTPTPDNPGQTPDPAAFWKTPEPEPDSGNPDPDPGINLGQTIAAGIQGYTPADFFTREIGEQLAEGNMDGANKQFQALSRDIMQQSVVQSAKIMQHLSERLLGEVETRIAQAMGGEKDSSALETAFPSMKDPAVAPVINGVFRQAMQHTRNDRQAALEMTRGMLRAMGKAGGSDFGIQTPARGPDDYMGDGPSSLVEELLGRKT